MSTKSLRSPDVGEEPQHAPIALRLLNTFIPTCALWNQFLKQIRQLSVKKRPITDNFGGKRQKRVRQGVARVKPLTRTLCLEGKLA
ncbi:hypothetical protein AVEN_187390-1 [Araneus ventricosus]|uniref:Uncharacterized protein n=1 Tax=Araneus ventricosus TaxID=182803 RepID=A0A4Y2TRR8_ARAVE|nr:hypothetical protein AVEN_187390-1 [Araneus ventricosus]